MPELPAKLSGDRWTVTQERIDCYATLSGADDPIHVDPESARRGRFGGTVAQGLLVYASLSELFMRGLPDPRPWVYGGIVDARFRQPARPGDALQAHATLQRTVEREGRPYAEYEVWCENAAGVRLIHGRAFVPCDARESDESSGGRA